MIKYISSPNQINLFPIIERNILLRQLIFVLDNLINNRIWFNKRFYTKPYFTMIYEIHQYACNNPINSLNRKIKPLIRNLFPDKEPIYYVNNNSKENI